MSKFQKLSLSAGYTFLAIAGALAWRGHDVAALVLAVASLSIFVTSGFAAAAGEG